MKDIDPIEHLLLDPKYNGAIKMDLKRELAMAAYQAGRESAMLLIQEQVPACVECRVFLTGVANKLREAR